MDYVRVHEYEIILVITWLVKCTHFYIDKKKKRKNTKLSQNVVLLHVSCLAALLLVPHDDDTLVAF